MISLAISTQIGPRNGFSPHRELANGHYKRRAPPLLMQGFLATCRLLWSEGTAPHRLKRMERFPCLRFLHQIGWQKATGQSRRYRTSSGKQEGTFPQKSHIRNQLLQTSTLNMPHPHRLPWVPPGIHGPAPRAEVSHVFSAFRSRTTGGR